MNPLRHRMFRPLFTAACAALLALGWTVSAHAEPAWDELEPGLYYLNGKIPSPTGPVTAHLLKIDFSAHRPVVRQASAKPRIQMQELVRKSDIAAVNGGYFEENGLPSGLVRSGGKTLAKLWGGGSGALMLFRDGAAIIYKKNYPKEPEPDDALQAGPVLVDPGGLPGIRNRSGKADIRSFAAVTKNRALILGATTGLVDLYDLAEFLRLSIGVDSALNLDGGPSTGFYIRHPKRTVQIEPEWAIPNAVAIERRQPSPPSP